MIWLQNSVSMIICFLIARMLIDRQILDQWLLGLLGDAGGNRRISPDLFFLLVSYTLSLFFSNTIVVLSLLPLVTLVARTESEDSGPLSPAQRKDVTRLGLALIFGANIGGMGSLIGSPINLAAVTYLQIQKLPGAGSVTFFSWLLFGLPVSLGLLGLAWLCLRSPTHRFARHAHGRVALSPRRNRALLGGGLILLVLLLASALQFALMPDPLWGRFNPIDLFHLLLLLGVAGFFLLWPIRGPWLAGFWHNLRFLGASLYAAPAIALHQIVSRGPFNRLATLDRWRSRMDRRMSARWQAWFGGADRPNSPVCRPDGVNPSSLVSLNRLLTDLPYLGFLLLAGVILLVYLLLIIGDNPATPVLDGWLSGVIDLIMRSLSRTVGNATLLILIFIAATVFLTELFNNTLVLFVAAPLLISSPLIPLEGQLPAFLLLTLAASAAFMSPIATPVNAIVSTSLPGFSLRTMLWRGVILNLVAVIWLFCCGLLAGAVF
jgi:sodium-dependent dicarboxylate transporter 2/3/5